MGGSLLRVLAPIAKPLWHRYRVITSGVTLGVRCAAFTPDNEICLVQHTYTKGWFLPGGGVDSGETIYQAAERELCEETGIIVDGSVELAGMFTNFSTGSRDHVALLVYREWHFGATVVPNFEIAELGLFPVDDLPAETTQSTKSRIAEIRDRNQFQHSW